MAVRRMLDSDVVHCDDAIERLADVRESLKAIDLRTYNGDDEISAAIKEAREAAKAATAALRYAKTLEWRR